MAEAETRIFVKKLPDGTKLTREVTGPSSEVEALYDGFVEQSTSKSTSSGSTSSRSTAGSSPSS